VQKLEGEEGEGWVCLRCGELVKKCRPWNGDVLEEENRRSSTGKIVGFAVDEDDTHCVGKEHRVEHDS
jgi:peroxin-2